MNKIEKLIAKLCPNGVEFKKLGEVCEIKTGELINKNDILKNSGLFPVVNSGQEPLGFIDRYNTEDDPIGITTRGAGVGSVTWYEGKYFRGHLNYSVTIKNVDKIFVRFLYFLLLYNQSNIQKLASYNAIPALNKSNLEKLEIPIPPLPIQREIADILDKFTALETELEAELEARKKQYEYYRNKLLTYGKIDKLGKGGGGGQLLSLKEIFTKK
jgi:type I restriction enzyme S subunit